MPFSSTKKPFPVDIAKKPLYVLISGLIEKYGGAYFVWLSELGHQWHHVNFLVGRNRGIKKPRTCVARPLLWSAAVAASAGQASMSSVEAGQLSAAATGQNLRCLLLRPDGCLL